MPRNGFAPIFIIVIVTITLALGGGVLYYAKKVSAPVLNYVEGPTTSDTEIQQQLQVTSSNAVKIVFSPGSAPTAQKPASIGTGSISSGSSSAPNTVINFTPGIPAELAPSNVKGWERYRNIKYGFEIFYPTGHTVYGKINTSNRSLMVAGSSDDEVTIAEDESKLFTDQSQAVILKIVVVNEDVQIDGWADQNISKYVADVSSISRKKTTVSGKAAVEITQPASGPHSIHKLVVIQPGNYFVVVTESAPSILLDQIFRTFKFGQ